MVKLIALHCSERKYSRGSGGSCISVLLAKILSIKQLMPSKKILLEENNNLMLGVMKQPFTDFTGQAETSKGRGINPHLPALRGLHETSGAARVMEFSGVYSYWLDGAEAPKEMK